MCGIAGIIPKVNGLNIGEKLVKMSHALSHRGPDGEGFMVATSERIIPFFGSFQSYERKDLNYIPKEQLQQRDGIIVSFAHRRLSIIDLSECGHQPMCNSDASLWITYNGEIYNYIELREELKKLGHQFKSKSDTEVILAAYKQWGNACVNKFNGMWAFCIYDVKNQLCFASRDRFGVKPFYYVNNGEVFAFASEQKAFVKSGIVSAKISESALKEYLLNGLLENTTNNFFEGVTELWPGDNLTYHLKSKEFKTEKYYRLNEHINLVNDKLSEQDLIERISETLYNAVKFRLRSDVEVGTCLSGGIDSSALAVTIAEITGEPLYCFTSVFKNATFNEEIFADEVAQKINGRHFKTEPDLEGFMKEADDLVYSQDAPIWDTSTFAQYKVMELAKKQNIKVVLDGQGADELFAGYYHHFVAKWNNLIADGKYAEAIKEISDAGKTIPSVWQFYTKERLKQKYHFQKKHFSRFLNDEFLKDAQIKNPTIYFNDVNQQLVHDIYDTRLKTFLRCEDRCGMWHSVESRTPFSDDIELIGLLFSFQGNKKIKNGVSKFLLREAVKNKLPNAIYSRYDKKGFETPMAFWMQKLKPQMLDEIKKADFGFVNHEGLEKANIQNAFHYKMIFKLFILSRWQKVFKG